MSRKRRKVFKRETAQNKGVGCFTYCFLLLAPSAPPAQFLLCLQMLKRPRWIACRSARAKRKEKEAPRPSKSLLLTVATRRVRGTTGRRFRGERKKKLSFFQVYVHRNNPSSPRGSLSFSRSVPVSFLLSIQCSWSSGVLFEASLFLHRVLASSGQNAALQKSRLLLLCRASALFVISFFSSPLLSSATTQQAFEDGSFEFAEISSTPVQTLLLLLLLLSIQKRSFLFFSLSSVSGPSSLIPDNIVRSCPFLPSR